MHWQIQSDSDITGDFLEFAGSVMILEGQRDAEIVLSLMPDTVPEQEELYTVRLTAVEGGATLDANINLISTHIRFVLMVLLNSSIGFIKTQILNELQLLFLSRPQGAC